MPAPRRRSSKSQGSDGPPLKKRKVVEPEIPLMDPNAIDHSLDLAPPGAPVEALDSFDLFLDGEVLNIGPEAVVMVDEAEQTPAEEEEEEERKPAPTKQKKAKRRN